MSIVNVLKYEYSGWCKVDSGWLQWSLRTLRNEFHFHVFYLFIQIAVGAQILASKNFVEVVTVHKNKKPQFDYESNLFSFFR